MFLEQYMVLIAYTRHKTQDTRHKTQNTRHKTYFTDSEAIVGWRRDQKTHKQYMLVLIKHTDKSCFFTLANLLKLICLGVADYFPVFYFSNLLQSSHFSNFPFFQFSHFSNFPCFSVQEFKSICPGVAEFGLGPRFWDPQHQSGGSGHLSDQVLCLCIHDHEHDDILIICQIRCFAFIFMIMIMMTF